MLRRLFVVAALLTLTIASQKRYDGYKVFHLLPSEEQFDLLNKFRHHPGYDFWNDHHRAGHPLDIMVSPFFVNIFEDYLKSHNVLYQIAVEDIQKSFDAERVQPRSSSNRNGRISFSQYATVDEINTYLASLAANYPDIVSVESIGKSYEGRPLNVIKISSGGDGSRPVVLIDAGIHAREWIAPATALYAINRLVENGDNKDLIASVDWHIIPSLNPDGYNYTMTTDRLWRKTRSKTSNSDCLGVDANRNFDYHWMETGASSLPCADDYAGSQAFSEPEAAALRDYVLANKDRIKLYLSFHTFGNSMLYPWGYTSDLPDDWITLDGLAHDADDAQRAAGGSAYTIGSFFNELYAAAGGSHDWVKGVGGVALSYTVELPGYMYAFDVPASLISETVQTFFPAIRVFGQYVASNF